MKKFKHFVCFLLTSMVLCTAIPLTAFAEINDSSIPEVEATEGQDVGIKKLDSETYSDLSAQTFKELGDVSKDGKELSQIPDNALSRRDVWAIGDPVFIGDGTLDEAFDIYVVSLTAKQLSFLKLDSNNSNLMAILYTVNNGVLDQSTGWGVRANAGIDFINVPAGEYAIVIGSTTGTETGTYKLMWNCSNPSGANYIINYTDDLSRVMLYYNSSTIRSNGENILTGLTWEEHETWHMPLGYSARDMKITLSDTDAVRGIYLGSFSSTAPYSAPNALLIDVNRGTWLYFNSYYRNDTGDVTHIMDWYDPSGLKTPRTFGEGSSDFSYGPNYIVINLDKFEVCEFLSPFNYHYTKEGGREFTLTNLQKLY